MTPKQQRELAARIRDECIDTAVSAYERAAISGLCGEGAFEAAVSAMRMMNIDELVADRCDDVEPEEDR